jgi:hypothetical protein
MSNTDDSLHVTDWGIGNASPSHSRFRPRVSGLLQLLLEGFDLRVELRGLETNMFGKPAGHPERCHSDL